jgi:hypothetical protein
MSDLVVESSATAIMAAIREDSSLDKVCAFLIECEKAQHRYQWASGYLLLTLMESPQAPKKPAEFVDWLADRTGMHLTQNEIKRRIAVYKFYSVFGDARIIELIQDNGVRIAYHAIRAIDHSAPEQARAVLEACVQNPNAVDETLRQFGKHRKSTKQEIVKVRRSALLNLRDRVSASPRHVNGRDWVPLTLVLELLDALEIK